jgi:hypothetical protein
MDARNQAQEWAPQRVAPMLSQDGPIATGRLYVGAYCECLSTKRWPHSAIMHLPGGHAPLAGPAHSEAATGENTPNQLAPGQGLAFSDLEGAKIQIKLATEMLVQREGGPKVPITSQADWNVTVESEAKIGWSFQPTVHSPRGDQVGQKIASTATLDKPWYTPNGEAIWQYTEATLIFVRSFKNGGAMRMSIGFKQDGPNLTCVASLVFARERDKNSLTMNSAIDGVPFTAFSWKPVSSSCDVRR